MSTIERSIRCDDGWARRYARAQETGELDRGDPDAGRGRVDEDVLARLQLAEHNQRLVRCMYASDTASGREDKAIRTGEPDFRDARGVDEREGRGLRDEVRRGRHDVLGVRALWAGQSASNV
jgi:hypothetical protein